VAYGKLQEILPGRPISVGKYQQPLNFGLLAAAVACAIAIGVGVDSQLLIIGLLLFAAALGLMTVFRSAARTCRW